MTMRLRFPAISQRSRIGLGVSSDSIRAVGVHDRTIAWALEAPIDVGDPLSRQIVELLSRIPRTSRSMWRRRVLAAVGPSLVQTKRLNGVPATTDARLASAAVREGVARFFMLGDQPVVVSDVVTVDDQPWAAAFDRSTLEAIEAACTEIRLTLAAVIPAVIAIPAAIADDVITWRDGDVCVEIRHGSGVVRSIRRAACGEPNDAVPLHTVTDLAVLGDDALRFADAYAAAVSLIDRPAFAAPLHRDSAAAAAVSRRRALFAGGLCAASMFAAAIAPGIAAERAGRDARDALGTLATKRAELHETRKNLALVTGALDEVASFEARRRSPLAFLGQLTAALPEGSAVVTLRLDSASGTVVALTPRASALVNRLDTIPSVVSPEIVGPVTREVVSGRDVERVTLRFTLSQTPNP